MFGCAIASGQLNLPHESIKSEVPDHIGDLWQELVEEQPVVPTSLLSPVSSSYIPATSSVGGGGDNCNVHTLYSTPLICGSDNDDTVPYETLQADYTHTMVHNTASMSTTISTTLGTPASMPSQHYAMDITCNVPCLPFGNYSNVSDTCGAPYSDDHLLSDDLQNIDLVPIQQLANGCIATMGK